MPAFDNQRYTVGFIFDSALEHILLVHKQKPDWQKGKLNGVGGKYEPGETAAACIRRETQEEAALDIPEEDWVYAGEIVQDAGNVGFLAAIYRGDTRDAKKNDYEDVEWFEVKNLPENIVSNLRWLIPLAIEKLEGKFKEFSVRY